MSDINEYVVFDATDPGFYAGKISLEFTKWSKNAEHVWFFQPTDWVPSNGSDWYGSTTASMTHVLVAYSHGHATAAEAQAAADGWSKVKASRLVGKAVISRVSTHV